MKSSEETINKIEKRLKRYNLDLPDDKSERSQAAVLLPIISLDDPCLLLTERASHLGSHAGEVAWPGGKHDFDDEDLLMTALRETHEEVGIAPSDVRVIGELRPFISKFGLLVTPYIGVVHSEVPLQISEDEISSVFSVPLDFLLDDPRTSTNIIQRHGETHIVPVYHYDGYKIWGLTAMILLEFMQHAMGIATAKGEMVSSPDSIIR